MRLFINESEFVSVIKKKDYYSCQIMELHNGFGGNKATITDNQTDVVSHVCTSENHPIYSEVSCKAESLEEICQYHALCVFEYYRYLEERQYTI